MSRPILLVFGVFALNLFGKFLGFLRIQQVSVQLGVTYVADALFLALVSIAIWEAVVLSGACVPTLTAKFVRWSESRNVEHAVRKTVRLNCVFLLMCLVLAATMFLLADSYGKLVGPGLSEDGNRVFASVVRALALAPVFSTLCLFAASINRLHGGELHFAASAIIINLLSLPVLILGPRFLDSPAQVATAYGLAISAASMFAAMYQIAVMRADIRTAYLRAFVTQIGITGDRLEKIKSDFLEFAPLWLPLVVAVGALEINSIVDMAFGTAQQEGGAAALGYADRLSKIVMAVLGGAIFVVADPRWSRFIAAADSSQRMENLALDMGTIICAIAPVYAVLILVPVDIAQLAFGYGRMEAESISLVASLMVWLAAAGFLSFVSIAIARVLIFTQQPGKILRVNLCVVVLNVALNYLLTQYFGLHGIVIATLCVGVFQLSALSYFASKVGAGRSVIVGGISPRVVVSVTGVVLLLVFLVSVTDALAPLQRISVLLGAGYAGMGALFFFLNRKALRNLGL